MTPVNPGEDAVSLKPVPTPSSRRSLKRAPALPAACSNVPESRTTSAPAGGTSVIVTEALASGELVAPFQSVAQTERAYFAKVARNAATRSAIEGKRTRIQSLAQRLGRHREHLADVVEDSEV